MFVPGFGAAAGTSARQGVGTGSKRTHHPTAHARIDGVYRLRRVGCIVHGTVIYMFRATTRQRVTICAAMRAAAHAAPPGARDGVRRWAVGPHRRRCPQRARATQGSKK